MSIDSWSLLALFNLIVAACLVLLNVSVLGKPTVDRRKALVNIALQLDIVFWTATLLLAHNSTDLTTAYAWDKVAMAVSALFPPLCLLVALSWSGRRHWFTRWGVALLVAPQLLFGLAALSNDSHHQFFASVAHGGNLGGLVVTAGPIYYALGAVSYVYITLAVFLFFKLARESVGWTRQVSTLVLSVALPSAIAGAISFATVNETAIDITQLLISVGGSVFSFVVIRHWLVDLVKTALTQAAENMGDALLVIDPEQRVIDANEAARHVLSLERVELQGRPIQRLMEGMGHGTANIDEVISLLDGWRSDPLRQIDVDVESLHPPATTFRMMGWPIRNDDGSALGHVLTLRNVTAIREAERSLQVSEARYRGLFENATDIVYTHDLQGYFTSLNKAGERISGYNLEKDGRFSLDQVVAPDQRQFARQMLTQRQPDPLRTSLEMDILAKDGRRLTVEVNSTLLFDRGKPVGMQGIARDVTEARASAKRQGQMVEHLRTVEQTALALNSRHDLDGLLREVVAGVSRLTDADRARVLVLDGEGSVFAVRAQTEDDRTITVTSIGRKPKPFTWTIMEEGRARFVEDVVGEGAERNNFLSEWAQAYAGLPLRTPDRLVGMLWVAFSQPHQFTDDERQLLQIMANHSAVALANSQMLEDLKRAATTDPLTGLANHRCLMDRLDEEMDRARRSGHALAVLMVDIDGFKLINDTHGHTVGDEMLRMVASTIRESLRSTDILGRYGGDEFMALLPETPQEGVPKVCERVLASIASRGFQVCSQVSSDARPAAPESKSEEGERPKTITLPVRLSLGAAVFPTDSAARLELISLADAAMYAAKRAGGNILAMAHATDVGFLAAQNNTFSVLEGLVNAVDGKDHYTRAHSEHVARFALSLAESLGIDSDSKRLVRIAALLHDVGKIGIPDHVLRKPGPLDAAEKEMLRQHPLLSEMIMRETPQLGDILDAVRHHHERYDGQGYPRGLRGEEIPFAARILAIADSYSAMVTDRPYRRALRIDEAIEELRKGAGSQFDPNLVTLFIDCVLSSSDIGAITSVGVAF